MTDAESADELAKRLRALRERAMWTQETLSKRSGVPQGVISRMEKGPNRRPVEATLRRLADALVVPLEALTGAAPIPGAPPALLLDANPLVRALLRSYDDSRHAPSQFDAARKAVLEAGADLPQDEPDALAPRLLDAAAAIAAAGQPLTSLAIVTRALAAKPGAKGKQ